MRLSFVGITPDTPDSQCPAVFVDEDTGEIWFQGETVTDPVELAEVARHSPIGASESVVKAAAGDASDRHGGGQWNLRARQAGTGAASPA